jgi:hypothetical protein
MTTIYWSPANNNMLYPDPVSMHEDLIQNINKDASTFFRCPAFKNISLQTFVIRNPIGSSYMFNDEGQVISQLYGSLEPSGLRQPSIKNSHMIIYPLSFYFFSESPVVASLTSPFFHEAQHLSFGAIVPGEFNIDKWFRKINLEFSLWQNKSGIRLQKDEPIAYIRFFSEEKIHLQRFVMNDVLENVANSCETATIWEPRVSLLKRYQRFIQSKTKNIVLQEIKKNLVSE